MDEFEEEDGIILVDNPQVNPGPISMLIFTVAHKQMFLAWYVVPLLVQFLWFFQAGKAAHCLEETYSIPTVFRHPSRSFDTFAAGSGAGFPFKLNFLGGA